MEEQIEQEQEIETKNGPTQYDKMIGRHSAAIIPIFARTNYQNYQYPECMFLVKQRTTALEKALVQATRMGVDSIWLVCPPKMLRILRRKIPDFVIDDVATEASLLQTIRRVPIMLVPMQDRYAGIYDSVAWSTIYGATIARKSTQMLSSFLVPHNYLFMSPFCILSDEEIEKFRRLIKRKSSFLMSYKGKTMLDGELLPFSFTYDDIKACKKFIKEDMVKVNAVLKKEHADYYFKKLTLDYVFKNINMENRVVDDVKSYHRTDNWIGYCEYLNSPLAKESTFLNSRLRMKWIKANIDPPKKFGYILKEKETEEFLPEIDIA